jgi:glyoxylase-like metal-dependent hydrolase (beta-lactamase superfamily II)
MNLQWKVGDTTITKITEITYSEFPDLILAATPEVVKKVPWLFPHFVTQAGKLSVSIHSLVVDTPGAKLIVDTCIGNGRNREPFTIMGNLSTSYLEDLIAAGCPPESINYVLCTHLHLDHVGWNTRLVNGTWVPTFPQSPSEKFTWDYPVCEPSREWRPSGQTPRPSAGDSRNPWPSAATDCATPAGVPPSPVWGAR